MAISLFAMAITSCAQGEAGSLPAELAPFAAKYKTDVEASAKLRDQASAAVRPAYVNALAAAEQKATTGGKPDELKAVMEESESVKSGRALDATPSPLLPRSLLTVRSAYLRELAKVERDHAARVQLAAGNYLRTLGFAETKARNSNQAALLEQITSEKLKLTGSAPVAVGGGTKGVNLAVNGDFAAKEADDTPSKWKHNGNGKGAVTSENGVAFLRMISTDAKEAFFLQLIQRPPEAKEVRVSVRLRCPAIKSGSYGLVVAQRNAQGGLIARDTTCTTGAVLHSWKEFNATVKLKPDTSAFVLKCNLDGVVATVDFADVQAEAR